MLLVALLLSTGLIAGACSDVPEDDDADATSPPVETPPDESTPTLPSTPTPAPPSTPTPAPPSTPTPAPPSTPTPAPTPDASGRDQDGDGYAPAEGDCDDVNPDVSPAASELCDGIDNDCDDRTDEDAVDASMWFIDYDGDGFGSDRYVLVACEAPSGYVDNANDCDDTRDSIHPDALEVCDGVDNNCDVDGDEAVDVPTWYRDADGDGYGLDLETLTACSAPDGYAVAGGDCNDEDPRFHPGASEDDCADENDYNCDGATGYADGDEDDFAACEDCNDADPATYPGADERCDGTDNNCNTETDEAGAVDASIWYVDGDTDTYGDSNVTTVACDAPSGFVAQGGDCDDTDPRYHPEASEEDCTDPNDYNCDGAVAFADVDGDGSAACEDCNDEAPSINPGVDEVCDELDNNCDGAVDEDSAVDAATWYRDADEDGYGDSEANFVTCTAPEGYTDLNEDCDDEDPRYNPGALEEDCTDPNDYNCDGSTGFSDEDNDAFAACEDCNDLDASIYPDAEERCDGVDNNCDGEADESSATDATLWYADVDGDGYGDSAETTQTCDRPGGYVAIGNDCDDTDDTVFPGAPEYCDEADHNCDGAPRDGAVDAPTWFADEDGDDYGDATSSLQACDAPDGYVADPSDCDDDDARVNPATTWYLDLDQDGFGDSTRPTVTSCTLPSELYAIEAGDCDDTSLAHHPGAAEGCDGGDYNCDGAVDNDNDGDGYADLECGGTDCNDQDPEILPEPNGGCALGHSCLEILERGFSIGSGIYTIDFDGYNAGLDPIDVYCDMGTDDGGWTLIQSCKTEICKNTNHNISLAQNRPVNENDPNRTDDYRLSLVRMQLLRDVSTHWRATCDFRNGDAATRDYAIASIEAIDFTVTEGGGMCINMDEIDIRGFGCTDCPIAWWNSSSYHMHVDSSADHCAAGGGYAGIATGAVSSEDNWGHVSYNPYFTCYRTESTTTNWWYR